MEVGLKMWARDIMEQREDKFSFCKKMILEYLKINKQLVTNHSFSSLDFQSFDALTLFPYLYVYNI